MKKISIILILVSIFSCQKLSDYNIDRKSPSDGPAEGFFTLAAFNMAKYHSSTNVNENPFRLWAQHWQETQYVDESNYDYLRRNIENTWWSRMYREILSNLQTAKLKAEEQTVLESDKKVQLAILDVMECYTYYTLVNTYGNIPYSQALDIDNVQPKYDDAATVTKDLVTRLQNDVTNLSGSSGKFASADLVYGGDAGKWAKFANSLLLKIAVNLADYDQAYATTVAAAASANLISSNEENAEFAFSSSTPNTNPLYVDLIQSGRNDFVACKTLVDELMSSSDPRLAQFFLVAPNTTEYIGGSPGVYSNFTDFSYFTEKILAPDMPHVFIDFADVSFTKAEAVQRGLMGGDAATFFKEGIQASCEYWGVDPGEAATFAGSVAYDAGNWKESIGMQKWISNYNKGFDAWVDIRRLDFPVLPAPAAAVSAFPLRYTYSTDEANQNAANVTAAGSAIGGDKVTTKLFWDKF